MSKNAQSITQLTPQLNSKIEISVVIDRLPFNCPSEDIVEAVLGSCNPDAIQGLGDNVVMDVVSSTMHELLLRRADAHILSHKSLSDVGIPQILDAAIELCACKRCAVEVVYEMFCDLVETVQVSQLFELFTLLEVRESFFTKGPNSIGSISTLKFHLLKCCTLLTKRLTKLVDTELSGRILMFLARAFSLSDKSGVNFKGLVHSQGEIVLESEEEFAKSAAIHTSRGTVKSSKTDSDKTQPIDYRLYSSFWMLQNYFDNPPAFLADANVSKRFDDFKNYMQMLLRCFEEYSKEDSSKMESFPIKYLTNVNLFRLQLSDVVFRRHIAIQSAIFLSYVMSRDDDKTKTMPSNWRTDCGDLMFKVMTMIQSPNMGGDRFYSATQALLEREKSWSKWKKDECKAFEKIEVKLNQMAPALVKKARDPADKIIIGPPEVNAIWNPPPISANMYQVPDVVKFMEAITTENDPEIGLDDDCKPSKAQTFVWRCRRLMMMQKRSVVYSGEIDVTAPITELARLACGMKPSVQQPDMSMEVAPSPAADPTPDEVKPAVEAEGKAEAKPVETMVEPETKKDDLEMPVEQTSKTNEPVLNQEPLAESKQQVSVEQPEAKLEQPELKTETAPKTDRIESKPEPEVKPEVPQLKVESQANAEAKTEPEKEARPASTSRRGSGAIRRPDRKRSGTDDVPTRSDDFKPEKRRELSMATEDGEVKASPAPRERRIKKP